MIVHSLRATNLLKYARLELPRLPAAGIIAISGPNESGKTTVVETICFALFGRTFSYPPEAITRCIRWGATEASVELELVTGGGEHLRVSRAVRDDGTHGATLERIGEDTPVASGPAEVLAAVEAAVGLSFAQYLDTLYLAQREISAPHSQSDTIKAVAGGLRLEEVAGELGGEAESLRGSLQATRERIAALEAEAREEARWRDEVARLEAEQESLRATVAEYDDALAALRTASRELGEGWSALKEGARRFMEAGIQLSRRQWRELLGAIAGSRKRLGAACEALEARHPFCEGEELNGFVWELEGRLQALDQVQGRARALRSRLSHELGEVGDQAGAPGGGSLRGQQAALGRELRRLRRSRRLRGAGLLASVVGAGVAGAGWWLLRSAPESAPARTLEDWLAGTGVSPGLATTWVLPVIVVLAVLLAAAALAGMVRRGRRLAAARERDAELGRRIEAVSQQIALVDRMDEIPLPQALTALDELGDDALSEAVVAFADGPGEPLLDDDALGGVQRRLGGLVEAADGQLVDLRETIATAIGGLVKEREQAEQGIADHDEAIAAQRARQQRVEALEAEAAELTGSMPPVRHRLAVLDTGIGLLEGACRDLYARFNEVLRDYTGAVMPLLTEDRYLHMQIDDSLTVRVFSQEKNDFAGVSELSSGAQRQVLLAVRLAMAKALTEAAGASQQLVVLDEPFAFFDAERTRRALRALPRVDSRLSQLWIIAQEFEAGAPVAMHLECAREDDVMIAPAAGEP